MSSLAIDEEVIPLLKEDTMLEIIYNVRRAVDGETDSFAWRCTAGTTGRNLTGSKVYYGARWWIVQEVTVWTYVDEEGD